MSELELDCWWKKRVEQRKKKIGSQIKKDTRIPPYVERERNTLGLFVDDNDDDGKYCGWFDGSVIIITVIMLLPFESNRIKLNYRLYHFGQQNQIGGGEEKCFSFFFEMKIWSSFRFVNTFIQITWLECVCVVARVLRANKNKKLDTLVTHSFYQKNKKN